VCFIPNHSEVRGVDRRALYHTELGRHTESLIFIRQHCPGSFANVVIPSPSYMQHFHVTAQSHDQTLTQSDKAHSNHSAGLQMGRAMGIHTFSYSANCLCTDFGIQGILGSVTPRSEVLPTCLMYCFPAMSSLQRILFTCEQQCSFFPPIKSTC